MVTFDWHDFLQWWSSELLASSNAAMLMPPEVIRAGWLGYPGATETQIAQAEARLETMLPPSYRAFLQVSNGWRLGNQIVDKRHQPRPVSG
jgi:SMI1-KNR4 cell-wall